MAERSEQPTNPDTLLSILSEVRATNGKVDELEGRQITMDARLAKQTEVLGEPSRTIPGAFPGDPPKVIPASGACATLDRLAQADYQRTQASNKRSVLTSSGVALVVTLIIEGLRTWNGQAAAQPPPPKPAPAAAPITFGGGAGK